MSASQEKKARERAEREEKRLQQEKADRRAMTLYTVVGVVVVLAAIIMMVWSSGVIQRGMTAVEVGGEKFNSKRPAILLLRRLQPPARLLRHVPL